MEIDTAIELIKKIVKNNGTNDTRHIDLGLIPVDEKPKYEMAITVVKVAIMEGKLSQDDFLSRAQIN